MKPLHIAIGVLAIGGGYYLYKHKGISPKSIVSTMSTKPGYNSMMKISPSEYNNTSMESGAVATQNFAGAGMLTPWTLPAEQGNAMEINADWTSDPDTYAATVAHVWKQQAVSGSHL